MATLKELDEFYGIKDVYDMLEVIAVDTNNEAVANSKPEK
jgi:hypothetical protein